MAAQPTQDDAAPGTAPVPRVALTREEACSALGGMHVSTFERHVQPHLRLLRLSSRIVLVPVAELERWADEHAERTVP